MGMYIIIKKNWDLFIKKKRRVQFLLQLIKKN